MVAEPVQATQFHLAGVHDVVTAAVPDRECLVWGDRRLTYRQIAERSSQLGRYLEQRGLGCHQERNSLAGHESGQDHVALYLYNGNEYLEGMLGAVKARAASFNVNYRYVAEELRYLFANAQTKAIIYHASLAATLADVLGDLTDVEVLLQVADEPDVPLLPGAVDYEAALAAANGPLEATPSPDDLYVLYTGGTTGMPKGVLWRQHDIFIAGMGGRSLQTWETVTSYEQLAERAITGTGRTMMLAPLMHGAAQWSAFTAISEGATIILPPNPRRLDPVEVWSTVERERATKISMVGDAMGRPLVQELETGSYDTSSVRLLVNGGAAMNQEIKRRFLAKIPGLTIADGMGSSESGAQASHLSTADAVSTGTFKPGPDTVIIAEDLDRVLPRTDASIGWLGQGGCVPLGYLGDAAKTAKTFPTIDGIRFSIAGDRARWLLDGEIEMLGRDSVTINSGGEKIFAEEVEHAIAGHHGVQDVVVVGRPSERWGQEVVALVVRADPAVTADELATHAAQFVARYKLPKDWQFLAQIQRSPSGKADYRWARQQVTDGVESDVDPAVDEAGTSRS